MSTAGGAARRSSTSGSAARSCWTTQTPSRTTAAASSPRTAGEPQPQVVALARSRAAGRRGRARAATAPGTSSRRAVALRLRGTTASVATSASAADDGAEPEGGDRPRCVGDQAAERVAGADPGGGADRQQRDDAARRARAGRWSRAAAIASGTSPRPTPCIARPATSTGAVGERGDDAAGGDDGEAAGERLAAAVGPSPSRPRIGAAIAPASSAAVSDHCAALSETLRSSAIVGMSGAPSALTIAGRPS